MPPQQTLEPVKHSVLIFADVISSLDEAQLTELANLSFLELALKSGIDSNPADFASLSVNAMKKLQVQKKNNLWAMVLIGEYLHCKDFQMNASTVF